MARQSYMDFSLLQLRVLGLGVFVDGNVRVGVLPEGEEIFICGQCTNARRIGVGPFRVLRLQRIPARHAQMRQCSRPAVVCDSRVVDDLLEFRCRFRASPTRKLSLPSDVSVIEAIDLVEERDIPMGT